MIYPGPILPMLWDAVFEHESVLEKFATTPKDSNGRVGPEAISPSDWEGITRLYQSIQAVKLKSQLTKT